MAGKTRILFVCTGNSARSQIAEAFARYYGGDKIVAESAGVRPQGLNAYAIWCMNESGIDISQQLSKPLDGRNLSDYDYVITLCGDARDNCPALPAGIKSQHWSIPDPARVTGQPLEVLKAFRSVRNQVEVRVRRLLQEVAKG